MFNSDILEVAIGIIFVFILVSIICSAVREGIETWLKTRAAYLEHGIRELLRDAGGDGLASWLYEHPLISGLYPGYYTPPGEAGKQTPAPAPVSDQPPTGGAATTGAAAAGTPPATRERVATRDPAILARGNNLPSYIPSRNFALALMDLAARGPVSQYNSGASAGQVTVQTIRANVANIQSPAIQRIVLTALDTAQDDLERVRQELERWYDSGMDRVSGWYKRSTQYILFWIGLFVAVTLNVNALDIGNYLYKHPAVRTAVVVRAEEAAKRAEGGDTLDYRAARNALQGLNLPIGWDHVTVAGPVLDQPKWWDNVKAFLGWFGGWIAWPILGWLMTAFAATLGAPFWFDVLNKVMVIRSTVKPREKSREEGSEDRQPKRKVAPKTEDTEDDDQQPAAAKQPAAQQGGQRAAPAPPDAPGQQLGVAPQAQPATPPPDDDTPAPPDAESRLDGCDVEPGPATRDEDLPQAEGGVA